MILADGTLAYVGSENFSAQSLDGNRELGVLVADPTALARITSMFQLDWSTAQAA
jgi:phosphatidylserine/phosphatidylglycerophosphate/cardiolipin synthase-like enzyme